ncbi:hypothetical protein Tco_0840427 [Tanacetum coccineum]|uniref:Uncharacterized protein n=1 Tax=Tanacetum coccineum TaxID=301880 RepID=A0ABQ5ATI8_9ASTR
MSFLLPQHCTDGHAYPSHPVTWHLSQNDKGDDPKPSSFHKRYRSSYETPLSFSSPASSPTISLRKRYRGTSKLIKDTEVEGTESETESEELEDEGPGSDSEEAASEDQQQQAVPVKDTAANEPLGLGYRAARRRALELAEGTVPNTYEEDPEDGIVYVDIEGDMPPVRAPVQTPVSIEWSSGSLPISLAPLTVVAKNVESSLSLDDFLLIHYPYKRGDTCWTSDLVRYYPYLSIPDTTPVITPPTTQTNTTSDPSEDPSSDHIPPLPAISPFLSSDDDLTGSDTLDIPSSPTYDIPFTEITASTQRITCHTSVAREEGLDHYHLSFCCLRHSTVILLEFVYIEASLDFHSDASSNSSLRHPLSDHSSPDLPSTSAGLSHKRRRSLMTSVPTLLPVSGALSLICADLIPSPKRVRDSGYSTDVEVDPRETSLRDDAIVRVSDEPHLEQDSDPEIQAEIDECFAYADALRDRGIDARFHDHHSKLSQSIVLRLLREFRVRAGNLIVGVESGSYALTDEDC